MPPASLVASLFIATTAFCDARTEAEPGPLPRTPPGNPGNIFSVGEEVTVSLPSSESAWQLTDYDGRSRGEVKTADGSAALGRLEAGWFRLAQPGRDWVSLADLHANETWPYFDTYNLHHYEPFDRDPHIYANHRAVSAGRPPWVTECAVPVKWAGDESLKEPSFRLVPQSSP